MALGALLFDLDGTLVDSNELHVEAWCEAFESSGYRVAADRVRVEIGKGGDQLVSDVLGAGAEEKDGDALRKAHDQAFAKLAESRAIPPTPGAVELIGALKRRRIALALATSSKEEQIELVERASGVVWRNLFDVVVDATKTAASKPEPDIVRAAVDELRMTPAECAMVGDSEWDARAAARAGVATLGVTFGGNPREVLLRAGARVVYGDPAAVLGDLDTALRVLSPGKARPDRALLERLMGAALDEARAGLDEGEIPIGAVVARSDGEIVGRAHNRCHAASCSLEHAETEALRRALAADAEIGTGGALLVSTLEPCLMCLGAAVECAVEASVFAIDAPRNGAGDRPRPRGDGQAREPRRIAGVGAGESRALFERWLERGGRIGDERFVRALLDR